MKFEISNKENNPRKLPKNEYQIVCEAMHGDADQYEDFIFHAKSIEELASIYEEVKRISEVGFGYSYKAIEESRKNENSIWEDWPRDVTNDRQTFCELDTFKVVYYDEAGRQFDVKVSESNGDFNE